MKYGNPFKAGNVYITQTYHSNTSNTAIDLSANAGISVYAIADGVVDIVDSKYGSYCRVKVEKSNHFNYYVHTYQWPKVGTRIKKGDALCRVAPTSLNGGYPTHLHLGLQNGLYIMDYIDRSIDFKTNYADIKKEWFLNSGEIDWSKFKDLNYEYNTMNKGDKVLITTNTNIRGGNGLSFNAWAVIPKGAVGKIADGPRTADGYTWWDVWFEKNDELNENYHGWMANVGANMEITDKPVTYIDGSKVEQAPIPVDPCQDIKNELSSVRSQLTALQVQFREVVNENDKLMDRIDDLQLENNSLKQELESVVPAEKEETDVILAIVYKRILDQKEKI